MTSYRPIAVESITPDVLARTIEQANASGGLLIGSLARAALHNHYTDNPNVEYEARGEHPLYVSHPRRGPIPRDVDIVGGPLRMGSETHHEIDQYAFSDIVQKGEEWSISDAEYYRVLAYRRDRSFVDSKDVPVRFIRPLDSSIFEPFAGRTVYDIPCLTVQPALILMSAMLLNSSIRNRPIRRRSTNLLAQSIPAAEYDAITETLAGDSYRELRRRWVTNGRTATQTLRGHFRRGVGLDG